MRTSENTAELYKALAAAQSEFPKILKDSDNPFFKSKYADLASIVNSVQDALGRHYLAVTQHLESEIIPLVVGDEIKAERLILCLTTRLSHVSGQFEESTLKIPLLDAKPQTLGSASTYARRYSLQSILRVAAELDDDGNAASLQEQWTDEKRKAYVEKKKQSLKSSLEASLAATPPKDQGEFITAEQRKMLFAIGKKQNLSETDIRDAVGHCGYEHTSEIPKAQFNKVLDFIDPDFKHHQQEPF